MRILIVSATLSEIKPLANILEISIDKSKITFYTKHAGNEITILVTGVGMVPTAYYLGCINNSDFDIALNVGIAGSFNKDLSVGELVNVTTDCFAEMGADYGEKFVPLHNLDFVSDLSESFMTKNGELQNITSINNSIINNLKKVKGITVNTINGEASRIERIKELFAPDIESMEGAAFLYGCQKKKLPCFQLRTISNYIEPRNLNNWNIPLAISLLNKRFIEIIDAFL